MRRFEHRRCGAVRVAGLVLAFVLAVAGCSGLVGQATGELGRMQSLAAGCPEAPLLTQVDKDVSGSQDDPAIEEITFAAIRSVVDQAVACAAAKGRGHLSVRLFSGQGVQGVTLLDQDLVSDGATEIARLRRVVREETADRLFDQVVAAYPAAVAGMPRKGSDVVARFALAGEARSQVEQSTRHPWALRLVVVTDGLSSTPKGLSKLQGVAEAEELAAQTRATDPPRLEGAWQVLLVGVGRSTGEKPLAVSTTTALKAFWSEYLQGTGDSVSVVTDLPGSLAATPSTADEGR